ncbi:DUF2290 domain-containing protein [Pantoea agglomerans]|uniref:DUF2290 domain-containing protein n=1 Tax=Enterobacter agglomerans TaxID=549 RepID=UPI003C7A08A5
MLTSKQVMQEIVMLTSKVIAIGISEKENPPSITTANGFTDIGISGVKDISIALKNMRYEELYNALHEEKFYNFKFPDGGLVQLLYRYEGDEIRKHRLAYFPSPSFESFQNEAEVYMEDHMYAEVIDRRILPVPVRFDFDCTEGVYEDLTHPKSHFTLGQYKNCRIPVCSPISPFLFMDFILRSFYNTAMLNFSEQLDMKFTRFQETATPLEKDRIHLRIQ